MVDKALSFHPPPHPLNQYRIHLTLYPMMSFNDPPTPHPQERGLYPLPDNKILDWSKLKQIADHIKVHLKWKISTILGRKHCQKRRNCLLQGISPFLTMFSTATDL